MALLTISWLHPGALRVRRFATLWFRYRSDPGIGPTIRISAD